MRPMASNNGEGGEMLGVSMDRAEGITQGSCVLNSPEKQQDLRIHQSRKSGNIIQDPCQTGKLWQDDEPIPQDL